MAGLAHRKVPWRELGLDPRRCGRAGQAARAARELLEAFDELRVVVDVAVARAGAPAQVEVDDHLAELLLRRSPRLAARLRARVYDQLAAHDPELTRTLDALIEHDFDRGATAAALPVHRNTLTNRLNRIHAITGLDVDSADGRGLLWLAWLERRGQSSRELGGDGVVIAHGEAGQQRLEARLDGHVVLVGVGAQPGCARSPRSRRSPRRRGRGARRRSRPPSSRGSVSMSDSRNESAAGRSARLGGHRRAG